MSERENNPLQPLWLVALGIFLLFASISFSAMTIAPGPGVEVVRAIIVYGSAAVAIAVFVKAGSGMRRPRP